MPPVTRATSVRPKSTAGPAADGWDLIDTLHVLLYGESGTGKTTMWSSFPGPILCLICSGGNRPGELRSIDTPEMRKKVTPLLVKSFDQFQRLADQAAAGGYGTVVLDHATGFADLVLGEIIGKPVPEQKEWGLASQQQYGQASARLKESFRRLLNLPCHVVIVAQERVFKGDDDGNRSEAIAPVVGAALSPSVVGWLNPACDYVVQTFKRPHMEERRRTVGNKEVVTTERGRGVEFCLRCSPHDVYMTKFRRAGGVPADLVIVDPTYDKLQAVIRGRDE